MATIDLSKIKTGKKADKSNAFGGIVLRGSNGGKAAVAVSKETPDIIKDSKSPFKLSGATEISAAPEKKWPLGFVGAAAKAAYDTAKNTIEGAAGSIDEFLSTLTAENRAINPHGTDYTKETGQTIGMTPEQRQAYYEGKQKEGKTLNKVIKGGRATLAVANIAFLPVTTQIEAAKKVPVLKYPAEAASYIFKKLGEAGEYALGKAVDYAPISDEDKAIVRPFATELGAFTAQLVGIKVGFKLAETGGAKGIDKLPISEKNKGRIESTVKTSVGLSMTPFTTAYGLASGKLSQKLEERKAKNIPITPEEGKKIVAEIKAELPKEIEAEEAAPKLRIEKMTRDDRKKTQITDLMKNKPQDFRTIMENLSETYSKDQVVSIMQDLYNKNPSGKFTPREVADSIDILKNNGFEVQEVKPEELTFNEAPKVAPEASVTKVAVAKAPKEAGAGQETIKVAKVEKVRVAKEEPVAAAPKPIETKGNEAFTSRVFERMKNEGGVPELGKDLEAQHVKLKEDAAKAVDLVAKDKQKAYDIAMGKETSTEVTSTAVNIALAEKALQEKNYDLYAKLVKNRSLEQTRRGQEIVAEKGSIQDNSTSKYIKELLAVRLEALGKNYLGDLKNTLKKTTDKGNATQVIDREVAKVSEQIKSKKLDTKTALKLLDELACI